MKDRIDLIRLINHYNGSVESFNNLKDVICEISESDVKKNEPLMKELLFMAAQKMRTFGYNQMNEIQLDEIGNGKNTFLFQNYTIENFYTSETGKMIDQKQRNVIDNFMTSTRKRMILSAPTSFGKTFILREIIYKNRERYNNILLIFPTVSLLYENVREFRNFISDNDLDYKIISNTHTEINSEDRKIFIMTPERVLQIIGEKPELGFDFFFMDEIYKIDNFYNTANNGEEIVEDERDTVFRVVLYLLAKNINEFYLAGPYINLETIGDGFRRFIDRFAITKEYINTELVKKEHIHSWNTKFITKDNNYKFNSIYKIDKLVEIMIFIKNNNLGPTIIYGESKNKITKLVNDTNHVSKEVSNSKKLNIFIEHLISRYCYTYSKKNILTYRYWTMIDSLRRGVGIHHGAFPKYIQNEVLELFNEGDIKFLFATTSITEGVNTKAKNIVFYGKSKGIKELKSFDIKNINGRAGRYYHYFVGRIFYLDKSVFDKLNSHDESLDFITYGSEEIPYIDIDNSSIEDLSVNNALRKEERDREIESYGIDESVFLKNRLIDRLKQIELIELLKEKKITKLKSLVNNCSSIYLFLKSGTIYEILSYFGKIGLLTEFDSKKYGKIASDYAYPNGYFKLLDYHFDKYFESSDEINNNEVDKIYMTVFSDIRNIIEFKVPKYLAVFGNLLSYVCSLPEYNVNIEGLALDSITKFYELGVQTLFGTYLAETGFPIQTIRLLERNSREIMDLGVETITMLFEEFEKEFLERLDEYEFRLLKRILFNV